MTILRVYRSNRKLLYINTEDSVELFRYAVGDGVKSLYPFSHTSSYLPKITKTPLSMSTDTTCAITPWEYINLNLPA